MIINKYNSAKGNITTRTGVSTGAISSGSSSTGGGSLDRVLWGQNDEGEDIDGSMWVNGSLYIGAIDYGSEDDEATVDDSNVFVDDAEIGSVIAKALIQSKDMYCLEHPYITYPIVGGKKTDLRELFNGFDERIKANETNIKTNTTNIATNTTNITANKKAIDALGKRVSTNETNIKTNTTNIATNATAIKNLDTRVTANETNISTNTTEIKNINEKITNIKTNITALQDAMPVGSIIMFNGQAADIPSGWAICDGTNGTPNLIDKFVKGSNIAGSTGGASQVTLSVAQLPPHRHKVSKAWYGRSDNANDRNVIRWDDSFDQNSQVWTGETGLGLPIDIIPPYYTLIYIMKIGTTDKDTTQTT